MQKEEERENDEDSFLCPSFSTYSTNQLADIATQVITQEDHSFPQNGTDHDPDDNNENDAKDLQNDGGDSDFEFVAFRKAADGVFFDRHVNGPVFPVFNRDLAGTPLPGFDGGRISGAEEIRFSMDKLLIRDEEEHRRRRRDPPSSSSSEVEDELDAIPPGTYCVWTPNSVQASPNRCKKSNSTGSSSSSPAKKWRLLDLLRRSNSDGKNSFVFLTPSSSSSSLGFGSAKKEKNKSKDGANVKSKEDRGGGGRRSNERGGGVIGGERSPTASPARVSAHEALYVRNREMRRVDKRRSYLPYKQDLVGFCATLHGIGRTFPPF